MPSQLNGQYFCENDDYRVNLRVDQQLKTGVGGPQRRLIGMARAEINYHTHNVLDSRL